MGISIGIGIGPFSHFGGAFVPTKLNGLVLWLRSDLGITTASPTLNSPKAFDAADWTKSFLSVSPDQTTDPDETSLADLIRESSDPVAQVRTLSQTPGSFGTGTTVFKVRAKKNTLDRIYLEGNGGSSRVWFDLTAGTVGTQTSATGTITALSGGGGSWYLCEMSFTRTSGGMTIGLTDADNVVSYTVSAGQEKTLYLYNAEVVQTRVSAWADQSLESHDFIQNTAINQPRFINVDSTLNNLSSIEYDDIDDRLESDEASSVWKFLHDGSGATIALLLRPTVRGMVLSTLRQLDTRVGCELLWGASGATALDFKVGRGVAGYVVNSSINLSASTKGVVVTRMKTGNTPEFSFRVNGTENSGSFANPPSSSAPFGTLFLGDQPTSGGEAIGAKIPECVIYNRYLLDSEVLQLEAYFKTRYAV